VMIVMPTLAQGEKRQQPIVAGIIASDVALATVNMRQGVDAESRVINQNCTP